jgi:hypothetical protein
MDPQIFAFNVQKVARVHLGGVTHTDKTTVNMTALDDAIVTGSGDGGNPNIEDGERREQIDRGARGQEAAEEEEVVEVQETDDRPWETQPNTQKTPIWVVQVSKLANVKLVSGENKKVSFVPIRGEVRAGTPLFAYGKFTEQKYYLYSDNNQALDPPPDGIILCKPDSKAYLERCAIANAFIRSTDKPSYLSACQKMISWQNSGAYVMREKGKTGVALVSLQTRLK